MTTLFGLQATTSPMELDGPMKGIGKGKRKSDDKGVKGKCKKGGSNKSDMAKLVVKLEQQNDKVLMFAYDGEYGHKNERIAGTGSS